MVVLEFLFWLALLGAIFSYFLYPAIVWVLPVRRRGAQLEGVSSDELPVLTLIVTVHNEIERIGAKLADLATQDYPHDRLEVIVASDASSDGTDEQV
jgi:cellulose synthase/poly-beta-1,6-N-acetylglucosamine synthase-like glycosyltransferase